MSGPRLQSWCAFDLYGFQLDERIIVWDADSERPTMFVPAAGVGQLAVPVASRAFDVPPGPIAKRRPAMHKAALAFFAPLMEARS